MDRGISRREFVGRFCAGLAAYSLAGCASSSLTRSAGPAVRFGICADVHKDLVPDADERLGKFVAAANERGVDFVVQLGDFCRPYEKNRQFLDVYKSFHGPAYHVLGNHDTDGGFRREQTVEFWGSPDRYYSFDCNGMHFVVLDCNDKKAGGAAGYPRYVGTEQREWLAEDLAGTDLATVVFSHQGFGRNVGAAVENAAEVRGIFERANRDGRKVIAAFNGHEHADYVETIGGIHYVNINSMSYQWLGGEYQAKRFSEEIEKAYPAMRYTAPYRDSLYAFVTIGSDGVIEIEGRDSEFVPPTPADLKHPTANTPQSRAGVSSRRIR